MQPKNKYKIHQMNTGTPVAVTLFFHGTEFMRFGKVTVWSAKIIIK
jgi:hypothetical protein